MSTATKPGGRGVVCNSQCGCPVPCTGGITCRCASEGAAGKIGGGDIDPMMEHKRCSCGEHCGCNPCTCPKSAETTGTGKSNCKCGDGCTCATCAAA